MPPEQHCALGVTHKVLTYVEYRAVSEAFQNIDPPPPLHPKRRGRTHSPGGEGGEGANILVFWKTPDIGLASYSLIPLRSQPT